MDRSMSRSLRAGSLALAALTFASAAALVAWDLAAARFPPRSHEVLGALPLALVAAAYLVHAGARRASGHDLVQALLLAAAFLFWAANQYWPDAPHATLWNDIAVVLFVLDVLVTMSRSPGAYDAKPL
jgi:hypothetical protein